MFRQSKAAQAAAFLLERHGGTLEHLKLVKMLYLADRLCLELHARSLLDDRRVAMKHGPVLSMTLDCINGRADTGSGWSELITRRSNNTVSLAIPAELISYSELSAVDREVLSEVYVRHGDTPTFKLVDFTHEGGCPEWSDPGDGARDISLDDVLREIGYDEEQRAELCSDIADQREIDRVLPLA